VKTGEHVIARVATFHTLPDGVDADALGLLRETVKATPGYVAGFHLRDPQTNKGLSVAVFEDKHALGRVRDALARRPEDRKVGVEPDEVEFFEAIPF
jgi:hypothetical protein